MDLTIARAWALPLEKTGHRCLMVCLAKYSISTGYAWCSVSTLARECCASRRTVHNWLNDLIKLGYVERRPRRRNNGGKTSSRYFLTLPAFQAGPMAVPGRPDRDGTIRELEDMLGDGEDGEAGDNTPCEKSAHTMRTDDTSPCVTDSYDRKQTPKADSKAHSSDRGSDTPPELELQSDVPEDTSDPVDEALAQIWEHVKGRPAAKRSSQKEVRAALVKICKADSVELSEVVWAWQQYMSEPEARKDDGAFVPGPHRWLGKERYLAYLDDPDDGAAAAGGSRDMGTLEKPTKLAMEIWMMGYARDQKWKEEYGPRPGFEGCRVSELLQRKYGVEPYGGGA